MRALRTFVEASARSGLDYKVERIQSLQFDDVRYVVARLAAPDAEPAVAVLERDGAGRWLGVFLGSDIAGSCLPEPVLDAVANLW